MNTAVWCNEIVLMFLEWVNKRLQRESACHEGDVVTALRTAMAMLLMPGSFYVRDYVLFKLGNDKCDEVTDVGLDKVVDVGWSYSFVCVRPRKIELLSDCYSEDGFNGSNWEYFPIVIVNPSGEWSANDDNISDFVFPDKSVRGVKVVLKGRERNLWGDVEISDICLYSQNQAVQRHWRALTSMDFDG